MIWVGILMAGIVLAMQAWAIAHELHWQTIVFNVLCLSQMGHVLAIRSEKQSLYRLGIFSNKPLIGAVLVAFLLQFAVTFLPFLQPIFQTEDLTFNETILVVIASSLVFFAVEIEKAFSRRKAKNNPHN